MPPKPRITREMILDAAFSGNLEFAYSKFRQLNMLKKLTEEQKRAMFDEMIEGTKAYLGDYK